MSRPLQRIALVVAFLLTALPSLAATGKSYFFAERAVVDQPVAGSIQAYGGELEVSAPISGDLFVVGATVRFTGGGAVHGNLIHGASRIDGAEGRVQGETYPLTSLEGAAGALTKNAVVATLLLLWLLGSVAIVVMGGREIRLSSTEVRASALHCFVVGLVGLTSFVLTAIAFSYLVPYLVGVPLLIALGVFALLTKIYGMVAVFHAIGLLVAGPRSRNQLASRRWFRGDVAYVVAGLLVLGAIRMIPVIGTIVWALAGVFAVGTALATRFGRREPWFLDLREVEY